MNDNKKRTKNLMTDTVLFGLSSFGSKILVFLLTPLYTRVLATEEFGIADLINTTIQFVYPILTLAISEATLRYAMKKEASPKKVLNNSLIFVFLSSLILLFLQPLFKLIDSSFAQYWLIFVAIFFMYNLQLCFSNFVKGIGLTKLFALQSIVYTLSIVVSNILLLVVFKTGLNGYLISMIIGHVIPIVLMFFGAKLYRYLFPVKIDKRLLKDMLAYSIPMIPTILSWTINTSIDKYIIIWSIGMGANGIYSVANKIPSLLTTVVNVFLQAWQLSAITYHEAQDEGMYYTKVYGILNAICAVGSVILMVLAKPLSAVLFDEAYFTAWQSMPMLTLSAIFSSLSGFLAAPFRAYMKTKHLFISTSMGAIVNIVLSAVLINFWGIIGASIATAVSFGIVWIVRAVATKKLVAMDMKWKRAIVTYGLLFITGLEITFHFILGCVFAFITGVIVIILYFREIKFVILWACQIMRKRKRNGETR